MVINVHAGHNPDGKVACGAVGLIKESTENRKVKDKVIELLKADGHTVYDCTCDNGTSVSDVLNKIIAKCNAHDVDLDVSIHFNSIAKDLIGDGKTTGTEVLVYSATSKSNTAAKRIVDKISALGFKNRGVKVRTNLTFLKKTKAPSLLVECCFVDDADDVKLYNTDKMAKAIAEGIIGKRIVESAPVVQKPSGFVPYVITVNTNILNVRKGPSANEPIVYTINRGQKYTIIEEKNGWGLLKSKIGWIKLSYTIK